MNQLFLRRYILLLIIALSVFGLSSVHAAISCSSTTLSPVAFGNVDPQSTQTNTTATLNYTCSNNGLFTWSAKVCFSIGVPGGGSINPRRMQDGSASTLNFQLYQDPARSVIWGSQFFGGATPLAVDISIPGFSTRSGSITLHGRVLAGQNGVAPGTYTSNYLANDTAYTINDRIGSNIPTTCDTTQRGSFPFMVSANVTNKCTVNAGSLDFGTNSGLLNTVVNANAALSIQCSTGTAYHIGLNAGQHSGGSINARQMALGANTINYQLFRNAARTLIWGNTVGTNTVAGTGAGNTQNLTVYGSVPPQNTPPAGIYNDTIVVTVTY